MEKLFCKQIIEQGLDKAIEERIQEKENTLNSIWFSIWLFTIIILVPFAIPSPTQKVNDKEIRSFYQAKVDSLQNFVDTTLDITGHVLKNK